MSVKSDLTLGNCQGKVKTLLEKYPILRDNDKKLYLAYLNIYHFLKHRLDRHPNNAYQIFTEILLDENTPMFESVSRARRKIQEENKNLRGLGYKIRKESAQVISDWAINK